MKEWTKERRGEERRGEGQTKEEREERSGEGQMNRHSEKERLTSVPILCRITLQNAP